jgi:hypothetical protein
VEVNSAEPVQSSVLLLDLDETCIYGNDGNDLPLAMQWMGRPNSEIQQLYKLLVSPYLKGGFFEHFPPFFCSLPFPKECLLTCGQKQAFMNRFLSKRRMWRWSYTPDAHKCCDTAPVSEVLPSSWNTILTGTRTGRFTFRALCKRWMTS